MKDSLTKPSGNEYAILPGIANHLCTRCTSEISMKDKTVADLSYCSSCRELGMVTMRTNVYRSLRILDLHTHRVSTGFTLSPVQKQASDFVVSLCQSHENGFLWAVCGAGKTEILYAGIEWVLNQGGRVCLAIPRKDVVLELAVRLAKAFPDTIVKPLCEGYKDDTGAHLLVSTIHQLIGYYHEFDLMIVDEADAFPYAGNPMLERLIAKAVKPEGVVIKMSATLNETLRSEIHQGRRHFVIPARFHRHALPVPIIKPLEDGELMDPLLLQILRKKKAHARQCLIFVPTLAMGQKLNEDLHRFGFDKTVFVSSQTEGNSGVLDSFRRKRLSILVTTAILERGVTFPDIDVIALHAEHEIYSATTLVQIAGRVGRHPDYAGGEVLFFMVYPTKTAQKAIRSIHKMNSIALRKGLIDR